jgi:hypothetical protein
MESYKVIWDDKEIGHLTNPMLDMSYLEGDWKSNGTSDSVIFERLLKSFDPRQVMTDLTKGLVITLRGNGIGDFNAVAISLDNNKLFLRRLTNKLKSTNSKTRQSSIERLLRFFKAE